MKNIQLSPLSLVAGSAVTAGLFLLTGFQGTVTAVRIFTLTPEQAEILSHQSIVYLDDGQGGTVKTLRISGINVQIVNGLDATNGYPLDPGSVDPELTGTNGLGNLIVGYNELGNYHGDDRTGSHNIVFGHGNTHSSFGGIVGPLNCTISGPFASVTGGTSNRASGLASSVSGGVSNRSLGTGSSISGGLANTADGVWSSISGGSGNQTCGYGASVSGGNSNTARGDRSSVSGGNSNTARGQSSSVSGGANRTAPQTDDWLAGMLFQDD